MHSERKQDHLRLCLQQDVRSRLNTGLGRVRLRHLALPELDLAQVDLSTRFLGRRLGAPLMISAMTGGADEAGAINQRLARAAQEHGLAMGLGSVRAGLLDASLLASYRVRDVAPDILLFSNLGVAQLQEPQSTEACRRAVAEVGADALVLHLNPLQEALQPEGNRDFSGLLGRIATLCEVLEVPVIAKEVGWGISGDLAQSLVKAGVAAIDVAGAGGTSWSRVEAFRCDDALGAEVASAFDDWGIPTVEAVMQVRAACPAVPLIASGGVRTGVDVAKCLALGADLAGMALPLLAPAMVSWQEVSAKLTIVLEQLRIAMFCVGARDLSELDHDRVDLDGVPWYPGDHDFGAQPGGEGSACKTN